MITSCPNKVIKCVPTHKTCQRIPVEGQLNLFLKHKQVISTVLTVNRQCKLNKDHQRMMVDPMFMIVQSLRSFPTAVTTTAVAPTEVILPAFT